MRAAIVRKGKIQVSEVPESRPGPGEVLVGTLVIGAGKVGIDDIPQAFSDLRNPERHAKIPVEPWRA